MRNRGFNTLWVFIVFACAGIVGGGYWYFGAYMPKAYAQSVVPVFLEWQNGMLENFNKASGLFEERGAYDYSRVLVILRAHEEFLAREREKLAVLKPPPFGVAAEFHHRFLAFLDRTSEIVRETKKRGEFLAGAKEYRDTILELHDSPWKGRPATAQEMLHLYETEKQKVKRIFSRIFNEEVAGLQEISFSQLKTAWEAGESGYDILVAVLKRQDQNAPLASYPRVSSEEESMIKKYMAFADLLKETIRVNTAYNLLDSRFVGDIPVFLGGIIGDEQKELLDFAAKLQSDLQNLLQEYPYQDFVAGGSVVSEAIEQAIPQQAVQK